jgi:hypothetical protein
MNPATAIPLEAEPALPKTLRHMAYKSPEARSREELERCLLDAAALIENQHRALCEKSRLTGIMRVALQPFAVASGVFRGTDSDVLLQGPRAPQGQAVQVQLGHLRQAFRAWRLH